MLIPLAAGVLSALCLWFSWRAWRRCRAIEGRPRRGAAQGERVSAHENDDESELELELLAREQNLELGLAKRNVQALQRAALFAGTGLSFWALTGGRAYDLVLAGEAFAAGLTGWAACGELHRRIGSLADSWRGATNAANRQGRRQGVDPSERTG